MAQSRGGVSTAGMKRITRALPKHNLRSRAFSVNICVAEEGQPRAPSTALQKSGSRADRKGRHRKQDRREQDRTTNKTDTTDNTTHKDRTANKQTNKQTNTTTDGGERETAQSPHLCSSLQRCLRKLRQLNHEQYAHAIKIMGGVVAQQD